MMRHTFMMRSVAAAALSLACGVACAQVQDTTTTFEYDIAGNLTKVTAPLNHVTLFGYDALSRRTSATDATGTGTTRYEYDPLDQLIQVTDARAVVTKYTVDGLGNLTQTTSGDTGATINTYDEAGNLASSTDAKLQKTTYKYDVLDRLTLVTYSDASTLAFLYDQGANGLGRLSRITDASGAIEYGYDLHGRVTKETRTVDATPYATLYHYDNMGRLSGMTYPSGRTIDYARDTLGRISQISSTLGTTVLPIVTQVSYQPFGPVQSVGFANGQTQARSYDLDGRLASFSLATQTMAVAYDAASRITGIADAANVSNGQTYGYDALDRLTNVATPTAAQNYGYDKVGNRTLKVNNGATTAYDYAGPGNRLTQVGAQAIVMDANGSITNKGSASFNYDARGRMLSANTAIGLVTYTINSLGQRVRKVTPTETTVFHYDMSGKLIAETTTTGASTKTQEYVFLGDMPVAVLK